MTEQRPDDSIEPTNSPNIDILGIGAHPDDAELGCGGTLLKLAALGYTTGIIDMTRGEAGTRGTPEIRACEAEAAAKILNLTVRDNLEQPDANVWESETSRIAMVRMIRKYRPKVILTHHWEDPHPDHSQTSRIVQSAAFLAGLHKYDTLGGQQRHRPVVAFFVFSRRMVPSFLVDIHEFAQQKRQAIQSHHSQLFDPNSTEPPSRISAEGFIDEIESRQRYYGALINSGHAEAFYVQQPLNVEDPLALLSRRMNIYS